MHPQVFCALREWQDGEWKSLEFKDFVYQPVYEEFCNHLKELKNSATAAKKKLATRIKSIARAWRYVAFFLFNAQCTDIAPLLLGPKAACTVGLKRVTG